MRLYAGQGTIDPSDPLRSLGYHGTTRVLGGQLTYPVIRSRQQTLYAVGALDEIESDIRTTVPVDNTRASFDSMRMLRVGTDSALEDFLAGEGRPGIDTITVRGSKGLTAFGSSSTGSSDIGRAGARPERRRELVLTAPSETQAALDKEAADARRSLLDADSALQAASPRHNQLVETAAPAPEVLRALRQGEGFAAIVLAGESS